MSPVSLFRLRLRWLFRGTTSMTDYLSQGFGEQRTKVGSSRWNWSQCSESTFLYCNLVSLSRDRSRYWRSVDEFSCFPFVSITVTRSEPPFGVPELGIWGKDTEVSVVILTQKNKCLMQTIIVKEDGSTTTILWVYSWIYISVKLWHFHGKFHLIKLRK